MSSSKMNVKRLAAAGISWCITTPLCFAAGSSSSLSVPAAMPSSVTNVAPQPSLRPSIQPTLNGTASTANYQPANDAPGAPPSLNGSASLSSLSATAILMAQPPLTKIRDGNLCFVKISVRNDSANVALVHGGRSKANFNGPGSNQAVSSEYIESVSNPKLNLKGRLLTAAVTAGTLGMAGPIFYENLTPDQHAHRYLGTAIGDDGTRHAIEDDRFGLRVVMPGDETTGWVAFSCPNNENLSSVIVPISYSGNAQQASSLVIPIIKSKTLP